MATQEEVESAGRRRLRGDASLSQARTEEFLDNNDVEKAAVRAAPRHAAEAEDMAAAEAAGQRRAKGEDPAMRRRANENPRLTRHRPWRTSACCAA